MAAKLLFMLTSGDGENALRDGEHAGDSHPADDRRPADDNAGDDGKHGHDGGKHGLRLLPTLVMQRHHVSKRDLGKTPKHPAVAISAQEGSLRALRQYIYGEALCLPPRPGRPPAPNQERRSRLWTVEAND